MSKKIIITIIMLLTYLFSWNQIYGNSMEGESVKFIQIFKYDREVNMSATHDCDQFNGWFQLFCDEEDKINILKILIVDSIEVNKIVNAFEKYEHLEEAELCNGRPRIRIIFFFTDKSKYEYYLEGYHFRIVNKVDKPYIRDEWLTEYLRNLGGFI